MIIAQRTLRIHSSDGQVSVPIVVNLPRADAGSWVCDFSIGWPEGAFRHHGMGVVAIQAIQLAMQMLAIHLYMSPYHLAGTLSFEKPGRGYGFMLPFGGRDIAIGDDKTL